VPPLQQASARLGDVLTITGLHLDGTNVGVQFLHPLWTTPVELAPQAGGTATTLSIEIPNVPGSWPAGFYTLEVLVQRSGETFSPKHESTFVLARPSVTIAPASAPAGPIVYTANVAPDVLPAQHATLMLDDAEFVATRSRHKAERSPFRRRAWWLDVLGSTACRRRRQPDVRCDQETAGLRRATSAGHMNATEWHDANTRYMTTAVAWFARC